MLRPGQTLQLPVRSPAMVFHVIEGAVAVGIDDQNFTPRRSRHVLRAGLRERDVAQRSSRAPAFLFIADETPLHRKLGVFESRG